MNCPMNFRLLNRLALLALLVWGTASAEIIGLEPTRAGQVLVTDPAASKGKAVAILADEPARGLSNAWALARQPLAPGLYRLSLRLRMHQPKEFDLARLRVTLHVRADGAPVLDFPVIWASLDGRPGTYSVITREFSITNAAQPMLVLDRQIVPPAANNKRPPGQPTKTNPPQPADGPVAGLDEAAVLLDNADVQLVSDSLAIERVWPEKVHVYPGETNPVMVTVRNYRAQPATANVRLTIQTGLGESTPPVAASMTVPGNDVANFKLVRPPSGREFGQAASVELTVDGKVTHTAIEYYSVSTPVWKTAIQGNGFISWYGREAGFAPHVDGNRRDYVNVEEAFSWQPSSWTDLNPTTDDWWSGQGNGHNSLKGLREWMTRSHTNGIKMITYSWPTASGQAGFDWGQRFPDILCREEMGVAPRLDLNDLSLYEITHTRPELWKCQSGTWLNNFINLGLLRAIQWHADEVIRSSLNFGWDGLRFDFPPGWSAMGTNDVQREIEMFGLQDVMKQLMPECNNLTTNIWTGEQISNRNVRYFRYIFSKELGPQFALSYNVGSLEPVPDNKIPWFAEMSRGGGQLMNEAIRNCNAISNYMEVAIWHTDAARAAGGYSCLFKAERCAAPLGSAYSAIFTFALGSHPYLDYGWAGMPAPYTRFMTRYGEYCWDLALTPITPEKAGITVESKTPLLWERFIRKRQTADQIQTVVHLIAKPELEPAKSLAQSQVEWSGPIMVTKQCRAEPTVWLLTAEPDVTAIRLPVEHHGAGYSVTVPTLRLWSLLVWSEKP